MRVNEVMLNEYLEDGCLVLEFENEKEYLNFMNNEEGTNFKTLLEAKEYFVYYQLEHNGKVYYLGNDDVVVDVLGEDAIK